MTDIEDKSKLVEKDQEITVIIIIFYIAKKVDERRGMENMKKTRIF
jgi:hypothetical protein